MTHRARVVAVTIVGVIGAAAVIGVTALALGRGSGAPSPPPTGDDSPVEAHRRIFAVSEGDPVNVDLLREAVTRRCIATSGDPYLSSRFCFALESARATGAYTIMFPVSGDGAPLIVGFLPAGKRRAAVTAGDSKALGESRGHVFLVVLPRGALGPTGNVTPTVEYG